MSSSVSSNETVPQSKLNPSKYIDRNQDLFATILQCSVVAADNTVSNQSELMDFNKLKEILKWLTSSKPNYNQHGDTHINLLESSIRMQWPILSLLSVTLQPVSLDYCWFVWLLTSVEKWPLPDVQSLESLSQALIKYAVERKFVRTLYQSFEIFYPNSNFKLFTDYLARTSRYDFTPKTTELLQTYLIAVNRDEFQLSCLGGVNILNFSIHILVKHLKYGFNSSEHRHQVLTSLCESGISDFMNIIDFCTIKTITAICNFTSVEVDVELFMRDTYSDADIKREYERICEALVTEREYEKAMQAADLLHFPKDNIIYESWVWKYEQDSLYDLYQCEKQIERYSLSPELVINFYIYVAEKMNYENPKKYTVLKMTLDVIKKHHLFPNESFNCDRIEYEMIISYLKSSVSISELDVYNSEYFETIMSKERNVVYKSFMELKEMAGVDELTAFNKYCLTPVESVKLDDLIKRLLDDGDIVEALRIQVNSIYWK